MNHQFVLRRKITQRSSKLKAYKRKNERMENNYELI